MPTSTSSFHFYLHRSSLFFICLYFFIFKKKKEKKHSINFILLRLSISHIFHFLSSNQPTNQPTNQTQRLTFAILPSPVYSFLTSCLPFHDFFISSTKLPFGSNRQPLHPFLFSLYSNPACVAHHHVLRSVHRSFTFSLFIPSRSHSFTFPCVLFQLYLKTFPFCLSTLAFISNPSRTYYIFPTNSFTRLFLSFFFSFHPPCQLCRLPLSNSVALCVPLANRIPHLLLDRLSFVQIARLIIPHQIPTLYPHILRSIPIPHHLS